MWNNQFENPEYFWLLIAVPFLAFWMWYGRNRKGAELQFPEASTIAQSKGNNLALLRFAPDILRLLAVSLIIIGLARPRTTEENSKTKSSEGIDIVLALDVSPSMLAKDLKPNRLEATKNVAEDFIKDRSGDRIGLVVYAGESFTQTPLTSDHKVLINTLNDVKYGLLANGTAIGSGLATAVNRLKDSKAKSKVAILLTDGENNSGNIDPLTAAQLAEEFNIRTYTIGVGTKGTAPTPAAIDFRGNLIYRNLPVNIDEDLLKSIATQTGGKYFRATDNNKLKEIYSEIDQLEKTKLQELKFYSYDEKFDQFVLIAFILFGLELILRYTLLKSFI
jgi:Ca-activated chloride channel family protein